MHPARTSVWFGVWSGFLGSGVLGSGFRLQAAAAFGAIAISGCASGPFASGTEVIPPPSAIPPAGTSGSGGASRPQPVPPVQPVQKVIRTQSFACASGNRITLVFLNPPDQVRLERAGKPPALLGARNLKTTFRYIGGGYEILGRKDGGVDWTAPGQLVTECKAAARAR